jgi:diacylglycerol kinase (ATP)
MQTGNSMETKPFSFRARANSIRSAWEGIYKFFAQEHNTWIHLVATVMVFVAAFCLRVSSIEMIALVIVTGFVWVAEIFNTAIERIMDFISSGYHPKVKLVKDLSAAAVLIASFIAVITGAIIFIPKIF